MADDNAQDSGQLPILLARGEAGKGGRRRRALALIVCLAGSSACTINECETATEHMGDLLLRNQSELDALELAPLVSLVSGELRITEDTGPITDLSPLRCLVSVEGDANVTEVHNLASLAGLEGLKRVGGRLSIAFNTALTNADLPSLEQVEGGFFFHQNNAFEGDLMLRALESSGSDVSLFANPLLRRVSFPRLVSAGDLAFRENAALRAISLPELRVASDGVDFLANPSLRLIDLSELRDVEGALLNIELNPQLTELRLGGLEAATEGLRLIGNGALTALELPLLRTLEGTLRVQDNGRLQRVLMPLARVFPPTDVTVEGNPSLNEFRLPQAYVVRSLYVVNNPSLRTLDLMGVSQVATLEVRENHSLRELDLGQLNGIFPVGDTPGVLRLESNEVLERLSLGALIRLDERLIVVGNPRLDTCDLLGHALRLGKTDPLLVTIEDNDDTGVAVSVQAGNQSELNAFVGARCVRGDMTLGEPIPNASFAFADFQALSSLESVFGDVSLIGVESDTDIGFPRLKWVGGLFGMSSLGAGANGAQRSVVMPTLESAGGMLISREPAIVRIHAPLLRRISGELRIDRMDALTELDLPQLGSIGGLTAHCNPSLDDSELLRIIELAPPPFQSLCGGPGLGTCTQALHETTCS